MISGGGLTRYWGRLSANYTLTSTTSIQKLFNWSTNGEVTLPVGQYVFKTAARLASMSATSGNGNFSFAGTAVLTEPAFGVHSRDAGSVTTGGGTVSNAILDNSGSAVVAASGAGTQGRHRHAGQSEITTAGTIIPSIALTTAAAAVQAAHTRL